MFLNSTGTFDTDQSCFWGEMRSQASESPSSEAEVAAQDTPMLPASEPMPEPSLAPAPVAELEITSEEHLLEVQSEPAPVAAPGSPDASAAIEAVAILTSDLESFVASGELVDKAARPLIKKLEKAKEALESGGALQRSTEHE